MSDRYSKAQREIFNRIRVSGSFPDLKLIRKDPRVKAFKKPLPKRWKPVNGERVYVRPGMTVGSKLVDTAEVVIVDWVPAGEVLIRVPHLNRWKSQRFRLKDIRPIG